MTQIRIDTERVREVGRRFLAEGDRLAEIGHELQRAMGKLDRGAWQGVSRGRADHLLGRVRPQGSRVAEGVETLGRMLLRVSDVFEQEDETAARNLAGMPWVEWDGAGGALPGGRPPGLASLRLPPFPPPDVEDFQEKVAPGGVFFHPRAVVPDGLANIEGAEEGHVFAQGLVHANSCGVIALGMILRTAYPKLTAQDVWSRSQELPGVDPNMTTVGELRTILQDYKGFAGDVRPAEAMGEEAVRSALEGGEYPVALAEIDGSDNRLLTTGEAADARTASHWVVVTGMSDREQWSLGEQWQWVEVYNPYDNEVEYYPWRHFRDSLSAAGDYEWLLARYAPVKQRTEGVP